MKAPFDPSPPLGVYLHFPYCLKKCPYCDFNSHALAPEQTRYTEAVLAELRRRADLRLGAAVSVYFGGGTPSLWAPREVGRVLEAIRTEQGLLPDAEVTLEVNPQTGDEAKLAAYREAGVTRFSIGVQSFDDAELRFLGRVHDAQTARQTLAWAKATGAKLSLDLIYALPGQSWDALWRSLDEAIQIAPEHVSAYTLSLAEGTPFFERHRRGRLKLLAEDLQASHMERLVAALASAGYARYEVSSFAKPGCRSVHNQLYWTGGAYLGLGAGAHSYRPWPNGASERQENLRAPEAYMTRGPRELSFHESLDRETTLSDRVMVGFRSSEGISIVALEALYGPLEPLWATLWTLVQQGLLEHRDGRFWPSAQGFMFGDLIAEKAWLAVQDRKRPESA